MKKISVIISTLIFCAAANQANAGQGGFVGIDGIWSHSKHTAKILDFNVNDDLFPGSRWNASQDGSSTTGDGLGFGLSTGFRVDVNNFYLSPELFYDYLNNQASDVIANEIPIQGQNSLTLHYRYGARMNVGMNIIGGLNIFINAGVADIKYVHNLSAYSVSRGGHKIKPIYGAGFLYDLTYNVSLKLSYDRMEFNTPYVFNSLRDNIVLETVKFGILVGF